MSMQRRAFLEMMAAGGVGAGLQPGRVAGRSMPNRAVTYDTQRLHPDMHTDPEGVEYFMLGNGKIAAVIQHATGEALRLGQTPLGLLIWDPHHFARKWSTFTFHPEWGLARGSISVLAGGQRYNVDPAQLSVERTYPDGVPVVVARWKAGPFTITEEYWVAADAPLLVREVALENPAAHPVTVSFITTLYHNHILFTDYRTDHPAGVLRADGYPHMELYADAPVVLNDRHITADAGSAPAGGTVSVRFGYVIRTTKEAVSTVAERRRDVARFWAPAASIETPEPGLNALYRAARDNLRAAVAESGRFDASIWQYNMEWVNDAAAVVMAACRTGQFELGAAVLENCFTRLVDENGIAAHASRFRNNLRTELNQQGMLLGAAWTYWAWSGDLELIRSHWETIRLVAEFPLDPRFLHESGLVMAEIELFEREAEAGILPGFDVTHQSAVAWGLERAADLARLVGDSSSTERWRTAGVRMREAMIHHSRLSLVDEGRLIKRRLPDGRRQKTLEPRVRAIDSIPAGTPLSETDQALLDPDTGTLWPLLLEQVDLDSPIARNTLDEIQTLWNEEGGGYLRYHPSGDPDAPGGWTLMTALIGQVMARRGEAREVRRIFDWLQSVQGARGGAFFEIYTTARRPVPPLPPMGLIVWGWAEIASLFVAGVLGAAPEPSGERLRLDPHLPEGLDNLNAQLRFRRSRIDVRVRRHGAAPRARMNGRSVPFKGGVVLADTAEEGILEIDLPISGR